MLAVHGITATSFAWLAVAAALADDVSLIAVDLRGRGESCSLPGRSDSTPTSRTWSRCSTRWSCRGRSCSAIRWAPTSLRGSARSIPIGSHAGAGRRRADDPGSADVDPEPFMRAFLGPALARLEMTFETVDAYVEWWLAHPAISGSDVDLDVLRGYVGHDLVGEPRRSLVGQPRRAATRRVRRAAQRRRTSAGTAGGAAVAPRGHGERSQPDAAARTGQRLGGRGPGTTPCAPSARRQPLHDHARRRPAPPPSPPRSAQRGGGRGGRGRARG